MLSPTELMALWRESKGRLSGGGRWWFRAASISTVRASRAFCVDGRWWTGPHCLPRDRAELEAVVRERARALGRRVS